MAFHYGTYRIPPAYPSAPWKISLTFWQDCHFSGINSRAILDFSRQIVVLRMAGEMLPLTLARCYTYADFAVLI
jgi:hypothetical protein